MTQLQQQIQQVFPTLPEAIKTLLLSADFNDRIEVIAKKNGLDEDQVGILIRITVRLLVGVISPTQFVSSIIDNTEVERETASFIAQEINRDIFNPIKDALKEVHAVGAAGSAQAGTEIERPLGTAPIVPKQMLKPDLSVLPSYSPPVVVTPPPQPIAIAVPSIPPPAATAPKPLPSFSVAAALGNIPSTTSPQSTTTAAELPKAHVGVIASASAGTPQTGNILEDKLGGTYRMKTETTSSRGDPSLQSSPTQIIPPPPQATSPASPPQEQSALAKALDPYRETLV